MPCPVLMLQVSAGQSERRISMLNSGRDSEVESAPPCSLLSMMKVQVKARRRERHLQPFFFFPISSPFLCVCFALFMFFPFAIQEHAHSFNLKRKKTDSYPHGPIQDKVTVRSNKLPVRWNRLSFHPPHTPPTPVVFIHGLCELH